MDTESDTRQSASALEGEVWLLTVKVPADRRQKGHLQWMVHSVAYFFWLVKNLKYTNPQGRTPFLALEATSLSCIAQRHNEAATAIPCSPACKSKFAGCARQHQQCYLYMASGIRTEHLHHPESLWQGIQLSVPSAGMHHD